MERANETRIGLAELAEEDLAKVSGGKSIDEQKAEANAKYDSDMSAATAQLILGTVAGAISATGAAGISHVSIIGKRH